MLSLLNLERIQEILLHVPRLVDELERHDSHFAASIKRWLVDLEEICSNNRLPLAADLAVLRGVLISTERGLIPEGMSFEGRVTPRKLREIAAAEVLRKAESLVSDGIRGALAHYADGEKLARQIVMLAQSKGLVAQAAAVAGHSNMLTVLWSIMMAEPELGPAATHLAGLVGLSDALILLDRMLPSATPVDNGMSRVP
jgi:hypothetical protein